MRATENQKPKMQMLGNQATGIVKLLLPPMPVMPMGLQGLGRGWMGKSGIETEKEGNWELTWKITESDFVGLSAVRL